MNYTDRLNTAMKIPLQPNYDGFRTKAVALLQAGQSLTSAILTSFFDVWPCICGPGGSLCSYCRRYNDQAPEVEILNKARKIIHPKTLLEFDEQPLDEKIALIKKL